MHTNALWHFIQTDARTERQALAASCLFFLFFLIIFIFWSSFKNTNMLTWHVPSLSPYLCSCLLNIFCMSLLPVCRNPAKEDSETPWPAVLGKSLFLLVYTARSQSLLSPSLSLSAHTHCCPRSAWTVLWQTGVKTLCSVRLLASWQLGNSGPSKHHHCGCLYSQVVSSGFLGWLSCSQVILQAFRCFVDVYLPFSVA